MWCPAVTVCPTTTKLAVRALGEVARQEFSLTTPKSDEHALYLRDGAELLAELAERMKKAAREYCDAKGGVTLPNGRVWTKVEQERETINLNGPGGAEARDIIEREAPGTVEVAYKTSKEAIKKVLAKQTGQSGKQLNAALEQVLVPLRTAGAIRTTTITKYEEKAK
jgi:type I restriction-modification system DNA methylase subunit